MTGRWGRGIRTWWRTSVPGRRWRLAGVLLAAVAALLVAAPAGAAPEPGPSTPPPLYEPGLEPTTPGLLPPRNPAPPPAEVPGLGAGDEMTAEERAEAEEKARAEQAASDWQKRIEQYKADRRVGGVLSAFEVTDRYGNPVSSYRIFSDTGSWQDWDLKIAAFLVDMLFLGSKWAVSFACFLIAWSLSFKLAGLLLKPALVVSDALYTNVLVQIGIPGLCLTWAGFVAGWHLMFGRRAKGWAEAGAALLISALSITVLAAPPQMLLSEDKGAVGTARNLAVEVAALIVDTDGDLSTTISSGEKGAAGWETREARQISRPITDALVDAFIVRPAMLLSYGQTFEGKCAEKFQESRVEQAVLLQLFDERRNVGEDALRDIPLIGNILGDMGDSLTDIPYTVIKEKLQAQGPIAKFEKDCVKGNVGALKRASMDKVGGAFFMVVAALLACAFITVVDASFLYAQLCLAKEAMLAKVALAIGVLPGPGRAWLTDRVLAVLRYLWLMILAVATLAVLIVVFTAVLNAPEEDLPGGVTVRFIVIDFICIGAFIYRKKLVRSAENWSHRARSKVGSSLVGGGTPSDLGSHKPQRSLGRRLLTGGMMLGALAAGGGAYGYARGSRALTTRLVRGTGRAIGGTARAAARSTKAVASGSMKLGKVGLQSTLGLPVYGPRAARRASAAITSVPDRVTTGAAQLGDRLGQVHARYAPDVQDFAGEYAHNVRSAGRLLRGRRPLGRYVPPQRQHPGGSTGSPPAPGGARPQPGPRRNTRHTPPRVAQPPASPAQAALQRRLHRIRTTRAAPPPPSAQPPRQPPRQQPPGRRARPGRPTPRPTPRRRRGGGRT
ncbi:hypothetical protein KQH21_11925 [Streptomyces sp. IpFD-1.1]|uniref:proline-rich domain-containing protein n=1 Tax=Streptomyces sp. IpFD-1.1 TaxID=2841664 RepID=UPI002095DCA4|nr:proline-rich domain-containing protein [Streptomyces sp. IpFD-1.1]MCO6748871.1 hypothetical protein [Streptomyces sp. IpFD-1.1]